jgi:hypothetical protein
MLRDQDFPISLEVQLLGGLSDGKLRMTANLCTPGTHVVLNGRLHTPHCTNSSSKTYDGDQWVRVEVLVHGDERVTHMVEGPTVLKYTRPQIGGGAAQPTDPAVKLDGKPLTDGYIALQAETAPIDFRKVELLKQNVLRQIQSEDVSGLNGAVRVGVPSVSRVAAQRVPRLS